jgi:hypothetical protein
MIIKADATRLTREMSRRSAGSRSGAAYHSERSVDEVQQPIQRS